MMMRKFFTALTLLVLVGATSGCATMNGDGDGACAEGTLLGTLTGGAIGAGSGMVMRSNDIINGLSTAESALAGAAGGAIIGALVGDMIEDQCYEERIAQLEDELAAAQGRVDPSEIARLQAEIDRLNALLASGKGIELERYVLPTDVLFAEGKAVLTDEGRYKLDMAAEEINNKYPNMFVNVEGHTDIQPIVQSNWKSNWELGAARALAVLHYLEDQHGIPGERLSATTYAYHQPAVPHEQGGNQENRRAEIVVYSRTDATSDAGGAGEM